ncbi:MULTISPECIES: hypothetical protein [unclassified Microcystis]|uniref:hypothetical protein n=1 Tax=unclassified Microcystis TaxID=2643300 RepID=UPI002586600F|nr:MULTISPECIES: hypothetical protein [unclassified Microcystis]
MNREGNGNQRQKRSQQRPEIATEDLYRHKKEGTQGQVQTVNLKAKPAEIGPLCSGRGRIRSAHGKMSLIGVFDRYSTRSIGFYRQLFVFYQGE